MLVVEELMMSAESKPTEEGAELTVRIPVDDIVAGGCVRHK